MEGPSWEANPEVKAEIEAMAGFSSIPDSKLSESTKIRKIKKRKSKIITKKTPQVKENKSTTVSIGSTDEIEFVNVIKQAAFTSEEKYKVLEARDKLIRLKMKKNTDITLAKHIVGTCPDMCPEKERLMREVQHQVSVYEQEPGEKMMNPSLAVKQYSRSSADQEVPLPHELRPVAVLQRTMCYLLQKIADFCDNPDINLAEWYHFLWDRTRGIRKDITQQELCCKGSVELVEQCARFHIHCSARLVAEDASVFDQKINTENLTKCLQTLKYMYHDLEVKKESCPNEPEFRAYVILLNLNDANFMWEVQQLRKEIQKSKELQFALQVYSALDKNNYVKFFNLVRSTSYLNACILLRYFVQVRLLALRTIIKSHSPRVPYTQYPLEQLRRILAFEGEASTIDFVEYHGLELNESRTRVVLDRKTFLIPEFPYALDRAMVLIESKRQCSVGEVICGKALDYIDFEKYIPYDSFDPDGYLNVEEYLLDVDLNILQRDSAKAEGKDVYDDKPSDTVGKTGQTSLFHSNIFSFKSSSESRSNSPMDTVDRGLDVKTDSNLFWSKPDKKAGSRIFAGKSDSISQTSSIFSMPKQEKSMQSSSSLFSNTTPIGSIFAQPAKEIDSKPIQHRDKPVVFTSSIQLSQKSPGITTNIFHPIPTVPDPPKVFNIFAQTKPSTGFSAQAGPTTASRKTGGFAFNLDTGSRQAIGGMTMGGTVPPIFTQQKIKKQSEEAARLQGDLEKKIKAENERRKRLEEEKRQIKLATEKQEENRKRIEAEMARRKLEEESFKKMEEEMARKKLEEERKRLIKQKELEKKRRKAKEMEERRLNEIKNSVRNVMDELIVKVESKIREDELKSISQRIKLKKASFYFKKWKNNVLMNKRKRKAIDQWPIWVNSTTIQEEASQLYTDNQKETLKYIKRYRNGLPIEIKIDPVIKIDRIDLKKLTRHILTRNFRCSPIKPQRNFLKVDIFLASLSYMTTNLKWIERIVNDLFDWRDNNYELIEESKLLSNRIRYCIKRKQSYKYDSTDGYIFIGDELSEEFYSDIKKIMERCKIHSDLSMVILLQNDDYDGEFLEDLVSDGKISEYKLMTGRYTPKKLVSYIENALIYIAEKAPKPPPLELDSLKSILHKYLATEVWKRMSSFAKWNEPYRICLTNPQIVTGLYNEALSKLESIVFDTNSLEYPDFPQVFQGGFSEGDQPVLPCDFKHFPLFWKNDSYRGKLKRIFTNLTLPKFEANWPPKDVNELEDTISEFCLKFYQKPSDQAYKIVMSILKDFDPVEDFSDIKNALWTEVMEVLVLEKLKEIDFSLREPFVSIYNELFVVYNKMDLAEYNTSTWFYLNHPVIKKEIDFSQYKVREDLSEDVIDSDHVAEAVVIDNADLEASLLQVVEERYDREEKINDSKKDLREFEMLMADLEQSMNIQKQISKKFQDILNRALTE